MTRDSVTRSTVSVIACILLVLASANLVIPGAVAESTSPSAHSVDGQGGVYQQGDGVNNSTVIHIDPEEADEAGDRRAVRRWLVGQMSEVVIDCTEQIRLGGSTACDRLDGEYPQWASRYVELRGDDQNTSRRNVSRTLNDTRQELQTFSREVREFRQLREEYREAKAAGDTQRAREIARRLVRQGDRVNRTGDRLRGSLVTFADTGATDVAPAVESISAVENNTTTTVSEVVAAEFIQTDLSVEVRDDTGSFAAPITFDGRLRAENGTPIATRQVTLRIGNTSVVTTTDSGGRFSARYRPTAEPVGERNVTVTYLPENGSLYGRSVDSMDVVIRQSRGEVTVTGRPASVAFNETLRVTGTVQTAGQRVPGVPVVATLGGTRLGSARTNESGRYTLVATVPAEAPAGDVSLSAGLPFEGRALTAPNASTTVRVEPTETTLSMQGNRTAVRSALIEGRLTTERGGVAGRMVTVSYDGSALGRVQTGSDGRFVAEVDLPAAVAATETPEVTVTYTGNGSNLESAREEVVLESVEVRTAEPAQAPVAGSFDALLARFFRSVDSAVRGGSTAVFPSVFPTVVALAVGLLGVALLGLLFSRRSVGVSWVVTALFGGDSDGSDWESSGRVLEDPSAMSATDDDSEVSHIMLANARERLSGGETDEAVIIGYEAVRRRLVEHAGHGSPWTHRELLQEYGGRLTNDQDDALHRLTDLYEQAAFSFQPTSERTTTEALADATYLLDQLATTRSPDPESE